MIKTFYNTLYNLFVFNAVPFLWGTSFAILTPVSLKTLIHKYVYWRQWCYNMITLRLLENTFTAPFIRVYHLFLFCFRYYSISFISFVEQWIPISTFALGLSLLLSRLHLGLYVILFCLLFIRLDFGVVAMCLFYKQHPTQLVKHFPGVHTSKRGMWKAGAHFIEEAANNPKIQAVAVAVAGALAWKVLDVYDTGTQADIAASDREAAALQGDKDREAAAVQGDKEREAAALQGDKEREAAALQGDKDREAAALQAAADREAEAIQRQLDRESAERIALLEQQKVKE